MTTTCVHWLSGRSVLAGELDRGPARRCSIAQRGREAAVAVARSTTAAGRTRACSLPIWTWVVQLGRAVGRIHVETVNSSSMPAVMLFGRLDVAGAGQVRRPAPNLRGRRPAGVALERGRADRRVGAGVGRGRARCPRRTCSGPARPRPPAGGRPCGSPSPSSRASRRRRRSGPRSRARPGASVTRGERDRPVDHRRPRCPTRAPSTHSSAAPVRVGVRRSPSTVADTVSGVAERRRGGRGDADRRWSCRSAVPSAYIAGDVGVGQRRGVEAYVVHQAVERRVRVAVATQPVVRRRTDVGHGDRQVGARRDLRAVEVERAGGALPRERDVVPLVGHDVLGRRRRRPAPGGCCPSS